MRSLFLVIGDLPLNISDVQRPGFFRISQGARFRHNFVSPVSPNNLLHLSEPTIFMVSHSYEISDSVSEVSKTILFGVKPCDLKGYRGSEFHSSTK
ncbi:MAG: hypothetical protein QXF17_04145 [Ignisphaera sp.]